MKKLFVFLFMLLPAATLACSDDILYDGTGPMADNDRPVGLEGLPAGAREFIATHFGDLKITLATIDREFMDTSYDVIFSDGTHIEFDSRGQWNDIECRGRAVPDGVMLPAIVAFLREHHPDARVRDIERDRRGYEVNLDNRLELSFDLRGNLRGYDD